MSDFILSCCSTADLTKEHFERRNISWIGLHFYLDGKEYKDDLGETISYEKFYQMMSDGVDTATSQVSTGEYLDYFCKFLSEGKDVLHICLSSGISGTYNSARNAAMIAAERYPKNKIFVLDSLCGSSGYGLFMDTLADKRDEGMDIRSLYSWAEKNRTRVNHWFFSTDLSFYVKGGRISKTAGLFGGILNICPLLDVDHLGRLTPRAKIHTKKKVIREIVDKMVELADNGTAYDGKCYICHSACMDDALEVSGLIEKRFPALKDKIEINNIGTTIGSHTGPGTIALFFFGKNRESSVQAESAADAKKEEILSAAKRLKNNAAKKKAANNNTI